LVHFDGKNEKSFKNFQFGKCRLNRRLKIHEFNGVSQMWEKANNKYAMESHFFRILYQIWVLTLAIPCD
jgi:hypothetical protein